MSTIMKVTPLPLPGRWCVHAYYTVCPWAPDGSGRLLLASADRAAGTGEVVVLAPDGSIQSSFGRAPVDGGFWHTGRWQTWGPNSDRIYFQGGTLQQPLAIRHNLVTGTATTCEGDLEGAPPHGEPAISGLMGMLYAAGYGKGTMQPALSPVPFAARHRHGLFRLDFGDPPALVLTIEQVLATHPDRDRIHQADREQHARTGDGLTLMCYCVRWSPDGSRLLFHFGNHCVDPRRREPRLLWIFTAKPDLSDIHLALDLSFHRRGVHWSWQPDGKRLLGYGPDPDHADWRCLAEVAYDGTGYRRLSRHDSGGHPSVSPADPHLVVTDEGGEPGRVLVIDTRRDDIIAECHPPREAQTPAPPGRNPLRVCHHPVWDRDGRRLLINTLPGRDAVVAIATF